MQLSTGQGLLLRLQLSLKINATRIALLQIGSSRLYSKIETFAMFDHIVE